MWIDKHRSEVERRARINAGRFVDRIRYDISSGLLQPGLFRLDAGETAILSNQLAELMIGSFDIEYAPVLAFDLLPVDDRPAPGADTVKYRQIEKFGVAKKISNFGDDLPTVETQATEFIHKVVSYGAAYIIGIQELRAAAMAGNPIEVHKEAAASMAISQAIDSFAMVGDSTVGSGVTGFLNNAAVPLVSPITGAWETATADEIINDVLKLLYSIPTETLQRWTPDTLLVDTTSWGYLGRQVPDTGLAIRAWLLQNAAGLRDIQPVHWLNTADVAGTGPRIVAYSRDSRALSLRITQVFEQFPPQWVNLAYKVPVLARTAGTIIHYPLSIAYMDGV